LVKACREKTIIHFPPTGMKCTFSITPFLAAAAMPSLEELIGLPEHIMVIEEFDSKF